MTTRARATIDDLYHVPGKAEIVNGELLLKGPTGNDLSYASGAVFVSLWKYSEAVGLGQAVTDNAGFHVRLPNPTSFSPDAAYYTGLDTGMRFFEGAPIFAVEVRSENDYGPAAEEDMAAKRADYFAAGTQIVWDVDLLSPDVIRPYRANDPDNPTLFRRGEMADAEPAVPGWIFQVDQLFKVRPAGSAG